MTVDLKEIVQKVESLPEDITWNGPATDSHIKSVATELNCKFPSTYRDFLRLTGGGGIESLWISGIEADDVLSESFGSVYGDTILYREEWNLPPHLIIIQRDQDDNEPFCLDTSNFKGDECPVVLYYSNTGKTENISDNFALFYIKYLETYFEGAGIAS